MPRVRVSATVDAEQLDEARRLTGLRDSRLLDEALGALLRRLSAEGERRALAAHPYDEDPDLAWSAPAGPDLPYEGDVPPEVLALAAARRPR